MDTLSVVLATYNIDQYIEETIDSVLNQTYKNIELIIVDDASTDNTRQIIQERIKQDKRILFFPLESNVGPGAARNIALSKSSGKYVTFIDHDDWQDLDRYENMIKLLGENSSKVCFSYAQSFNHNTGKTQQIRSLKLPSGAYEYQKYKKIIAYTLFPPWSKVYCRKFLIENNIKFAEGDVAFDDVLFHSHLYFLLDEFTVYASHSYTHRVFEGSITSKFYKADKLYKDYMECFVQCLRNIDKKRINENKIADYYYRLLRKQVINFDEISDERVARLLKIQFYKYKIKEGIVRRLSYLFGKLK